MGLNKTLYTKRCEGSKLSAAEKRFSGESPKKKSVVAKTNKMFVADILEGLL